MSAASLPPALLQPLQDYLDEESGDAGLRAAAEALARHPGLDLAALLDWVQRYPAERGRRTRVTAVLRQALGLPLMPGPVCRPAPD